MEYAVIGLLILLNGFFALSEIALVSSKRSRLEQLKQEGVRGSATALKLHGSSENFLSAIQVGITLISIFNGVYGGLSIAEDFIPFFQRFEALYEYANEIALVLTVLLITFFSILIGELVPKTIALTNPERIASRIAPSIHIFSMIFYPVVRFLSFCTSLINRILGIRKQLYSVTEGELRHMLKIASREGVIEKDQDIIHQRVFYFSDKKAKHIMTHRMDVEWLDINQPYDKIREDILACRHSRIICSSGALDDFKGFISVKEFLAKDTGKRFDPSMIIDPVIVPESADAQKVLTLFKQKAVHFCIVVNEFGSLEGIITPHDILENLTGDMPEDGEQYEPDIFVREDKSYLVNGDSPVEILDGIIDNHITDLDDVEYSTVAGFVLEQLRRVPRIGDKFDYKGYSIEVVDIDGNRIDKILIKKN